MDSSCL